MRDPYCYPGTSVLINKLNIQDNEELSRAETRLIIPRLAKSDTLLKKNMKFDFDYMKALHKFLFERIYDFAGIPRKIDLFKKEEVLGDDTVRYTYYKNIEKEASSVIKEMNEVNWIKLSTDDKAALFSILTAKLWQVHPFREGNTRTTISFACQFADRHGFPMDRDIFRNSGKYTRNALVKASDGPYSEYDYIKNIFKDSMEIGAKKNKELVFKLNNGNSIDKVVRVDNTSKPIKSIDLEL